MLYIGFVSASPKFILWLRESIKAQLGFVGHVTTMGRGKTCFQLKYAKSEATELKKFMYHKKVNLFLPRKLLKLNKALYIVDKSKKSSI